MSEERVKPRSLFVDEAIALALESRWPEALAVNQALVERHGTDEDTLNRIGKALMELGQREEALASYSSSLQMNPLNLIAQKNVRKLTAMLESKSTAAGSASPTRARSSARKGSSRYPGAHGEPATPRSSSLRIRFARSSGC